MKKTQFISIVIVAFIFFMSCKQEDVIAYKYTNEEQTVVCDNENNSLLNEALYQFEEDLKNNYDPENKIASSAYGRFLYVGFMGTADYGRLAPEHTLVVRKELVKEGILKDLNGKSNLNYDHPVVRCIIDNMEDRDLSKTLEALIETNTMDPKLFATRMRNFGMKVESSRYTALYVALDSYYQQLTMSELPQQELVTPAINE